MFWVHFMKLHKNDSKSTISFRAPTNVLPPTKKIREIGGALEKNDIFPTMSLYFHPPPQNSGTPSLSNLSFWNEQDLGNLLLKRNLQVRYELKILWWVLERE